MKSRIRILKHWFGGFFFALLSLFTINYADGQQLVYLGDLGSPNASTTVANGINDSDQVVGSSVAANGNTYAFLYSNGVMTNLGVLGGSTSSGAYSIAHGINNSGQVVGESSTSTNPHAFLYSNGRMLDLGTPPGGSSGKTFGYAINNAGQVTGYYTNNPAVYGDPIFYSGGVMTDLGLPGAPSPYYEAFPTSINSSGQIVGYTGAYPNQGKVSPAVFVYKNGTYSLNTLAGQGGVALGTNDSSQIVGYALVSGQNSAFLYSGGVTHNLGIPSSAIAYTQSSANAINNSGEIVGSASNATVMHAFLFSTSAAPEDLNTLYASLLVSGNTSQKGFTSLTAANAINSKGDIVGQGDYFNGQHTIAAIFLLVAAKSAPAASDTPTMPLWALALLAILLLAVAKTRVNSSGVKSSY